MKQFLLIVLFFFSVVSCDYAGPASVNSSEVFNGFTNLPTYLRTTGFHSSAKNDAFINLKKKSSVAVTRTLNASPISFTIGDLTGLMSAGKTHLIHYGGSTSMDIGVADAVNAQTWIMPTDASLFSNLERRDFIDPSTIPAAAKITGVTHAYKKFLSKGGTDYFGYRQYSLVSDEMDELGATRVRKSDNQVFSDLTPTGMNKLLKAPFSLGDNVTSDDETFAADNTGNDYFYEDAITVDAFGTLQLPNGMNYSCLRFKSTETVHTLDAGTEVEQGTPTTNYHVFWLTEEGYIFNGEVSDPNASGTTLLSNLNFNEFVPTLTLSVLPVELTTFTGKEENNIAVLEWTTASEKNNKGYDIEKSADGINFSKIGFVAGAGTVATTQNYSFRDPDFAGITYYRLKQIDFSGDITYSNIISIEGKKNTASLTKLFPNPTSGEKISLTLSGNISDIEVYNASGNLVLAQPADSRLKLDLDISVLPTGLYVVKTKNTGNELVEMLKFVKN